jgi:hypothetical protein
VKRLKLAIMAAVVASAFTAVSAYALEGLLPTKVPLVGTSGKGTLEDKKGNKITCTKDEVLGLEFTTNTEGKYESIHFTGCKAFGIFGANTTGDAAEVILVKGKKTTICLINSATLEFGVFLEVENTVINAGGNTVEVKGSVIGAIAPAENGSSLSKVLKFKQSKGAPAVKECKDEAGAVKKAKLEATLNKKETSEAGEETEETTSAKDGITKLELMDK